MNEYGKPIYVNELSKDDQKHLGDYVKNIISETHTKNANMIK